MFLKKVLVFLAVAAILAPARAAARGGARVSSGPGNVPVQDVPMSLESLRAIPVRAKGFCRTVFESGKGVESFAVEYRGLVSDFNTPYIDCQTADPKIKKIRGVAAGMSGSPVYFRDPLVKGKPYRIAGALSLGFELATIPQKVRFLATPAAVMDQELSPAVVRLNPVLGASIVGARPAPLAWTLHGASGGDLGKLGFHLENLQVFPEGRSDVVYDLVAGSPVSVVAVSGDVLNFAATGTVTFRQGNRVFAFGHPFLQNGPVELPLAGADVRGIISTIVAPFKFAFPSNVFLGTLTFDGWNGVSGETGTTPRTTEVQTIVNYQGAETVFHHQVGFVHGDGFFVPDYPDLVGLAAIYPALRQRQSFAPGTLSVDLTVETFDGRTILGRNIFSNAFEMPYFEAFSAISDLVFKIWYNQIGELRPKKVSVRLAMDDAPRLLDLRRISGSSSVIRGQTAQFSIAAWLYRQGIQEFPISMDIPGDFPIGTARVEALPAREDMPFIPGGAAPPPPESIEELLVKIAREQKPNDEVIVRLTSMVDGRQIKSAPIRLPGFVSGRAETTIEVVSDQPEVSGELITEWFGYIGTEGGQDSHDVLLHENVLYRLELTPPPGADFDLDIFPSGIPTTTKDSRRKLGAISPDGDILWVTSAYTGVWEATVISIKGAGLYTVRLFKQSQQ